MVRHAASMGEVHVIVNSDEWLLRKKGYALLDQETRRAIMLALGDVSSVSVQSSQCDHVCEELDRVAAMQPGRPIVFANGGDRGRSNTPEQDWCEKNGVECVWSVGGDEKMDSSSKIVQTARTMGSPVRRVWGSYVDHHRSRRTVCKTMVVLCGQSTSMQRHDYRNEMWVILEGEAIVTVDGSVDRFRADPDQAILVPKGSWHQITNPSPDSPLVLHETQFGPDCREDDIERRYT